MKCPSLKQIMSAATGGSRRDEAVRGHIRNCAACQAQADELARLDTFFRRNFQPPAPSPFLWTRIEAGLAAAPKPRRSFALGGLLPARLLAGAAALLIAAAGMIWFQAPVWFGPSQATILSHIDREYARTLLELQASDENPFDGREILEAAVDENPFQTTPVAHPAGPGRDENPFRAVIQTEYKN
jgi:hypothetical protein